MAAKKQNSLRLAPAHLVRRDGTDAPVAVRTGRIDAVAEGPPAGSRWTDEQWRGITATGKSVLVSAAAGSGKTSVLAERCVYLVCDAPDPCDIDELLVVTFTEAAAATMKRRIIAALRDRAARQPSPRLARQIALAEQAQVGTLHGFCLRILRQHFHRAGLDPTLRVLDADEARLMRRELARELFQDAYELDSDGSFHRLIDAYGDGDDRRVIRHILHAHDLLASVREPIAWMEDAKARIADGAQGSFESSNLGGDLLETINSRLEALRARCDEARQQVAELGFAKYAGYVNDLRGTLDYWLRALRDGGLDALCEVVGDVDWKQLKLPTESGDATRRELAKSIIDSVRDVMKEGAWRNLLRFTSAQWQDGLQAILPHAIAFLQLVQRFGKKYADAKAAARVVDFADLERSALNVLREEGTIEPVPSDVARSYHKRFAHVLVDEYQDINEVQDAILRLVSRECLAASGVAGNLFCVGDVKQSIYRFRLTEPRRFLQKQKAFRDGDEPGEMIDLQHNFRSRAPLLDALNVLFGRLMTGNAMEIEYDQTHHLRPSRSYPQDARCFAGAPIELHVLPDELTPAGTDENHDDPEPVQELERSEREAVFIARRIAQIVGTDGGQPRCVVEKARDELRPAQFGDIVILLRAMRFKAQQFADVLRQFHIPVHTDAGSGYFASMEVQDMLALLSVLENQRQDIPLAAVLRSPLAQLSNPETSLAQIRIAYPAGDQLLPFHEAAVRYAREHDDPLAGRLRGFFVQLSRWRKAAHRRPLADVIWQIYQQSGYLAFVAGLRNGQQRVANLHYLHERAAQFGSFQRQGLARFMRFLRELEEESDIAQAPIASEAQNVVRIMSIHQSKGLEFPIVFLADLGKEINLTDCRGHVLMDREGGLGMSVIDEARQCRYPSLALALVRERLRRQTLAEELRVLYVATTRAMEHLILVGTCGEKSAEKWESQWRGKDQKLPEDVLLDARTMLHWIVPVAHMTEHLSPPVFEMTRHSSEEVSQWRSPEADRESSKREQASIAAPKSRGGAPPLPPAAAQALERIQFEYPYQDYGDVAAEQAVSALKSGRFSPAVQGGPLVANPARDADLPLPAFFLPERQPTAADRGSATHRVLQHLNFAGSIDAADIAAQIEQMIARRMLSAAERDLVDIPSICWFMESEAGQLMRRHASLLQRELSVYFPRAAAPPNSAPSSDAFDQIMIRGRVDALIPLPDGAVIIDYKTDQISPEHITRRAEDYRAHVQAYREALEKITGQPVAKVILAFLFPRVLVQA